jgi:tetratricopeptide (TPR) repeat protein
MIEDIDPFSQESNDLVGKFDEMIRQNKMYFFDVEEFEEIIDFYLDRNISKKARAAIDYAMRQHPSSNAFRLRKAQYFAGVNNSVKALELLNSLEMLEPKNPDIFLTRGAVFSKLKKFRDAIQCYEKAAEYADDKDDIYTRIAFEYEELKDFDNAIDNLVKALDFNPENQAVIYELAFCFEMAGREEDSVEFFTGFLDTHPYSDIGWFNLGIALSNLQLYEKAVDAYEFAIAITPDFSSAYFNKANSLANLGRYREAVGYYELTLELEEADPLTLYYIGECYEKLEDFEKAYSSYKAALRLNPDMAEAWMGLGIINDMTGNEKAALKHMIKAMTLDNTNVDNLLYYADALFRYKMTDEALLAYKQAVEADPFHPDVWLDYSSFFSESGDYAKAINIIMQGIEIQPQNHELLYRFAGYLAKKGRLKEAYANFELALQINPFEYGLMFDFFPDLMGDIHFINLIDIYKKES